MTPTRDDRSSTTPLLAGTDQRFLQAVVVVSTLLRVPGFLRPPTSDEAGFLLVARTWHPDAAGMYGRYWVDRPPVLIAAYRWSDDLLGGHGPRILAAALSALLLVALHRLATEVAGRSAARVATVACAALLAHPDLGAWTAKGEVLGTPFVVLACLCAVLAVRATSDRDRARLSCGAGCAALLAAGFKQNLVGGLVFVVVLVLASVLTRRLTRAHGLQVAGYAAIGAAVPLMVTLAWIVVTPAELGSAWYQVVGFRADASRVLAASDSRAPVERAHDLVRLFVTSGMVLLLALGAWTSRRWLRGWQPVGLAVVAMTAVDLGGVVAGGSFWPTYLVPLVPDLALLLALAWSAGASTSVRAVAALLVLVAAIAQTDFAVSTPSAVHGSENWRAGHAIGEVARPGDDVVSLYGSPGVVLASGLPSPYAHLWSLPMRTMDPDLTRLRDLLGGPDAPAWLVGTLPLNSWHLDEDRSLRTLVALRYQRLPEPCGPTIWVRRDLVFRATPPVECG